MGRVLKDCADELAEVFTTIYTLSLSTSSVPACFKAATIIPFAKQVKVTCLNDYRPVALTPIPVKCLEQLVIKYIKKDLPSTLDHYHFVYRENRSMGDASTIVLHTLMEHLERKNTYARLLFIDFSSAFNTILPNKLLTKLYNLGLNIPLYNWTLDFLTNRCQCMRTGQHTSAHYSTHSTPTTALPPTCPITSESLHKTQLCSAP